MTEPPLKRMASTGNTRPATSSLWFGRMTEWHEEFRRGVTVGRFRVVRAKCGRKLRTNSYPAYSPPHLVNAHWHHPLTKPDSDMTVTPLWIAAGS